MDGDERLERERDAALVEFVRRGGDDIADADFVVTHAEQRARVVDLSGPSSSWRWTTALWIGAVVAALGFVAWGDVLDLALYGWDSFPLIAAARLEELGDLGGVLGEELMRGRFPGGHYWRPLVHLSFALDYALGGLDASAYHRTDLLVTLAGGVATSWLALALLGEDRRLWAAIAGLLFVLHPVHFELVPLPPRRADSLSILFTLLALWCVARNRTRVSYVAGFFALCAAASKETGVLCAVLAPALSACFCGAPFWRSRLKTGVLACWPALLGVGLYVALRTVVLGGVGGGARASVAGAAGELGRVAGRYAQLVFAPAPPSDGPSAGAALAFAVAAVAVLAWTLWRARPRDAAVDEIDPRRLCLWLALWTLALATITAVSGVYRAWYAAPFVPPLALLAGAACAVRPQVGRRGFLALPAVVVLAALQGWTGAGEQRWSEVRASSAAASELLLRFDLALERAAPGAVIELDVTPPADSASRHGVATKRPMTLRDYSLAAYAELAHPQLQLRFEAKRDEAPVAAPDEILVLLSGRASSADD